MSFVAEVGHRLLGVIFIADQRVNDHLDGAGIDRPLDLRENLSGIDKCNWQNVKVLFFCQTENSILELEHVPVFAAVAFGKYDNVVIAFEAFLEDFAEACVFARVRVDRNVAGAVQDPAEYGRFPEAR